MKPPTLEDAYLAFLKLLRATRRRYLVIGGLAVGMLGEARLTRDLDFLIFLAPIDLPAFLQKAKRSGFQCNLHAAQEQLTDTGTFHLLYRGIPIDCLTASTDLEEQMWRRAKRLRLFRQTAMFPSPEDLLLLKLLVGRPKDLLDAEGILTRHRGGVDLEYLKGTAQRMADELQDSGIWQRLQQLLHLKSP